MVETAVKQAGNYSAVRDATPIPKESKWKQYARAGMAACIVVAGIAGIANGQYFEFSKTIDPRINSSDFDNNGIVDYNGLKEINLDWLSNDANYIQDYTDLNNDGIVNFEDFAIFSNNWQWEKPTGPVLTVYEVISGDDDPQGPDGAYFWGAYILTNVSPLNGDNMCMEVTLHAGVNQGIDYNNCIFPDGWNLDDSDPNKTRLWTSSHYIPPDGGQKTIEIFSYPIDASRISF